MRPSLRTDCDAARCVTSSITEWFAPPSGLRAGGVGSVVGPLPTTPTFVLPYKRFATPCLVALAKQYLDHHHATYRSVVRHARCLIGYPVEPCPHPLEAPQEPHAGTAEGGHHQPVVPPSLVWRMVRWLGGLAIVLDRARQMILEHDPHSLCHRAMGDVALHKARTPERFEVLQTARQLLLVIPEWEECFGRKFFPQFATRAGFD